MKTFAHNTKKLCFTCLVIFSVLYVPIEYTQANNQSNSIMQDDIITTEQNGEMHDQIITSIPQFVIDLSFSISNKMVVLTWESESINNVEKFIVERSVDWVNYEPLSEIYVIGNSQEKRSHTFIDKNPIQGLTHYRIVPFINNQRMKETDISVPTFTEFDLDDTPFISFFNNTVILSNLIIGEEYECIILTNTGKTVFNEKFISSSQEHKMPVYLSNNLYTIICNSFSESVSANIIIDD